MEKQHASITAVGTVTSVGLSAVQTAASVRAGISRLVETDWPGMDGNPYRGGFIPEDLLPPLHRKTFDIPPDSVPARLLQLAGPALKETVAGLPSRGESAGLILGLRSLEPLQGLTPETFLENLKRQAQVRFDPAASCIVVGGRAAGLLAIHEAVRRIVEKPGQSLIAGAIDSYFDYPRLTDLDFEGRILNEINLDGFIPGEGAGFVALASASRQQDPAALGSVAAWAKDFECGHLYSGEPLRADGLTRALSDLFAQVLPDCLPCERAYVNLTGEHIGAKEWAIASQRNRSFLSDTMAVLHPAEAFGEAGAAMGPIMVALGIRGWQRGYQRGPLLVACSSDHGECAALYLTPPGKEEPGNG
jgi:3-oxoacyl-[acyl-carrier-protein] synthase-1